MCGTSSSKVASGILGSFSGAINSIQEKEKDALERKRISRRNDLEKKAIKEKASLDKGSSKTEFAANGIDVSSKTAKDVANNIDTQASEEIANIDDNFTQYKKEQALKKKQQKQNLLFSGIDGLL